MRTVGKTVRCREVRLVRRGLSCGNGAKRYFIARATKIKEDADHDDRRTGGDVEKIGQEKSAETIDKADKHRHEHHTAKTAHEESRR